MTGPILSPRPSPPDEKKALSRAHARRLREYYRSAGWPCLDAVEIDLLNAGLIGRVLVDGHPAERIRVTAAGVSALGISLTCNRQAFDPHEALVHQVAKAQAACGRLTYRGLMLRAKVDEVWKPCRPDVYSIRHTSVAAYAMPAIHEVKVRRADLLGDLKKPGKRMAYQALSSQFYYVMPAGMATVDEIPPDCGVLFATESGLDLGRASPRRTLELSVSVWMALARRGAEYVDNDDTQAWLDELPT